MARKEYSEDQIIEWIREWSTTTKPGSSFFSRNKISWGYLFEIRSKNERIAEEYARAQEVRGETVAENIQTVVGKMLKGDIASDVARVAIDAYKWHSSKLFPRKFAEKIQTEHSGEVINKVINLGRGINPDEAE